MIRALIFDLDDTLISERQYIESGYQHIAKVVGNKYGLDTEIVYHDLISLFNESSKNVFNRLLDKYGIEYDDELIFTLLEEYRNHFPKIEFYPDVLPCLEYLRSKDIKLGIITDGYANAQRQKLKAVKAENYFDEIIVTDELGREFWKPHPKAYEIMQKRLNVKFGEMVCVGDNPGKDFYIKNLYPITTVRVNRDGFYSKASYFEEVKEDVAIKSLSEIWFIEQILEVKHENLRSKINPKTGISNIIRCR